MGTVRWSGLKTITVGTRLRGLDSENVATVKATSWYGNQAIEVIFDPGRGVQTRLIYRADEPSLRSWRRDARGRSTATARSSGSCRRPSASGWRTSSTLYLAVHTSLVEPLPHQISAVYERDAAPAAAALPARGRPRCGQDDHGRAADQGTDRPGRPRALPGRRARQPRRAVAGRARQKFGLEFDILTSDMIGAGAHREPVRGESAADLPGSTT